MDRRKYQFMEQNQQRRAAGLKDKMPDIQKTLDTVKFLKTREVCSSSFTKSRKDRKINEMSGWVRSN